MFTVINENQRGLMFKNGKFVRPLEPGKYMTAGGCRVQLCDISEEIVSELCGIETLLANEKFSAMCSFVEVGETEVALHYIDGIFDGALKAGRHAFWTAGRKHEFRIFDTTEPMIQNDIPRRVAEKLPADICGKIYVQSYCKGRLFYNNRLVSILEPGIYYFWLGSTEITCDFTDTRLVNMDISGQEMLTADKVTVRVNFVCSYRVADFEKCAAEVDNYEQHLRTAAQLSLREYIGKRKLDDILENREDMAKFVFSALREKAKSLYVEVADAGIKDIILPGEIRDIMNTVLIAEKRAQAGVITRREEVASTRSLLNTAKLMEENETLYKLKELEYIERICAGVGNINLGGGGDVLSQLTALLSSGKKAV